MIKIMNNLFRMSLFIRNLNVMSKNAPALVFFRTASHCKNSWEEQNLSKTLTLDSNSPTHSPVERHNKILLKKLPACNNYLEVFDLIRTHQKDMNGYEAIKILSTLFTMQKGDAKGIKTISQTKEFSLLCNILKANVRELTESTAIQALKVLNYFNVPTSTVIVQMILQIIRQSVNNLSLDQIIFIQFLLTKCQKTPLVDALTIALPIVFQTNLKTQLDRENIDSLISVLDYVIKTPNLNQSTSIILNALNSFDEAEITPPRAVKLLLCLCEIETKLASKELLDKTLNILTKSMQGVNKHDITKIVYTIQKKETENDDTFYHEGLIDACIMTIVSGDMGFQTALNLLKSLNIIGHTSNSLLDYIAAKCFEDKKLLLNAEPADLMTLISGMSIADYKPVFWDSVKESLWTPGLMDISRSALLKATLHLASLECFYPELLATTFANALPACSINYKKKYLLLYHAVKIMYPEYEGPWPSDEFFESCNSIPPITRVLDSFKSALENALGGPQYVLSNMKTPVGYYADNVVVMRKGGFPIAINNADEPPPTDIEKLKTSPDNQVILLMFIPRFGYSRNSQRLSGFWSLMIKTLKVQTDYTVIPVSATMWYKLSEPEQLRYISQAIRLKCDELSAIVNS